MAYITCNHLTLGYDGREVVSDLSFLVEKGDYLCLLGENGAGKTSLINILLGLYSHDCGAVLIDDMDYEGQDKKIKNEIGFVNDLNFFINFS